MATFETDADVIADVFAHGACEHAHGFCVLDTPSDDACEQCEGPLNPDAYEIICDACAATQARDREVAATLAIGDLVNAADGRHGFVTYANAHTGTVEVDFLTYGPVGCSQLSAFLHRGKAYGTRGARTGWTCPEYMRGSDIVRVGVAR